jgi:hypothetical protein
MYYFGGVRRSLTCVARLPVTLRALLIVLPTTDAIRGLHAMKLGTQPLGVANHHGSELTVAAQRLPTPHDIAASVSVCQLSNIPS